MKYGLLEFDEPQPDYSRKILHVDMDAFYASVEIRDNPALADKPVVIAKHPDLTGGRGIVSTCNYIARSYGIHSAMAAAEAYRLCPKAVFISGRHAYYQKVSQQIREIFRHYTDLIEPLSLDEAFLDVTHNKKDIKSALVVGKMIQKEILAQLNLTCSVGVSYNKFIAKIASDYHKPFGITLVTPDDAPTFLKQLSIDKFYGVGRKSLPVFHDLGIFTGQDLYDCSLDQLIGHFGKMGYSLYFKVRGIHNAPVKAQRQRKSIGRENTYGHFLTDEDEIIRQLDQLSQRVYEQVEAKGLKAHTVTLKIRYENFDTVTRQIKLDQSLQSADQVQANILDLWQTYGDLTRSVRLLGVTLSSFEENLFETIPLPIEKEQ
ncbi:DNA polymerase IV [Eremococcus coleocola]|uniref:DNA polymerase IV n=1 Tax=Eremococcus coleocola ACS-139-V-Col8 TaxID=908337 RepID=E4KM06_9LACT|nr:DNA polymerase IV [Eremococcus coleocola]EFR32116.1 DNA polymerase IV [Eremococcus coleocola ACS-139-V-Col8]